MNISRISAPQFSALKDVKFSLKNGRLAHTVEATEVNKAKFPMYFKKGTVLVENPYSGEYLRRKKGVWYVHPDLNGRDDIPKEKRYQPATPSAVGHY